MVKHRPSTLNLGSAPKVCFYELISFPVRLTVGQLTLTQFAVVRIHHRDPKYLTTFIKRYIITLAFDAAPSYKGNTTVFGTVNRGSNPWGASNFTLM